MATEVEIREIWETSEHVAEEVATEEEERRIELPCCEQTNQEKLGNGLRKRTVRSGKPLLHVARFLLLLLLLGFCHLPTRNG